MDKTAIDTRKTFFNVMCELAEKDKDIIILVGDLGYSFKEEFEKRFPHQIINVGASEQNMVGLAQGLAIAGRKPYCYSGAIFMTMRPYEQIRACCFNNLNVKFVGTGASGFLGWTHNLTGKENEMDLFKNLPNLVQYYPQDPKEIELCVLNSYQLNNPCYIRV